MISFGLGVRLELSIFFYVIVRCEKKSDLGMLIGWCGKSEEVTFP